MISLTVYFSWSLFNGATFRDSILSMNLLNKERCTIKLSKDVDLKLSKSEASLTNATEMNKLGFKPKLKATLLASSFPLISKLSM